MPSGGNNKLDMTGVKINRLTGLEFVGINKHKQCLWRFECDCGKRMTAAAYRVRNGNTKSCGCLASEMVTQRNKSMATHKMTRTPTYRSWQSMIERCTKENHKSYERYKHLQIQDEWLKSFEAFLAHVGVRPKGTTLDRINNEQGYVIGNVRWATPEQQARNRRTNKFVSIDGKKMTYAEAAKVLGITRQAVRYRVEAGWTNDQIQTASNQGIRRNNRKA